MDYASIIYSTLGVQKHREQLANASIIGKSSATGQGLNQNLLVHLSTINCIHPTAAQQLYSWNPTSYSLYNSFIVMYIKHHKLVRYMTNSTLCCFLVILEVNRDSWTIDLYCNHLLFAMKKFSFFADYFNCKSVLVNVCTWVLWKLMKAGNRKTFLWIKVKTWNSKTFSSWIISNIQ